MSRDKLIEEMAFDIIKATSPLGVKDLTKQFDYKTVATDLYELYDWRKASEVAEEIFAEIERFLVEKLSSINAFRKKGDSFYDGEIHALELLLYKNAELKKKYTEGGE